MTSFGIGEIGIVLLLILVSFDAKQIGKFLRWIREIRSKFNRMQTNFKYQFDNLLVEEERKEELSKTPNVSADMRNWGANQVKKITSIKKFEASKLLVSSLASFQPLIDAKVIAAYSSLYDELDTSLLLKKILAEKKTLVLPYLKNDQMFFAPIEDLGRDTKTGMFGILEPIEEFRKKDFPSPDLFFIPGRCFDEYGGRIGRGKGYYDKFLVDGKGTRIGLGLDAQISSKKLSLQEHDQIMDYIISEKRIIKVKEANS